MKITKVRLIGLNTIDLPIVGAQPTDPYILKESDGLGPTDIDVSISETLHAGGVYQGRRTQTRELVFNIGLNPDYRVGQTVADLRTALYGMLSPGPSDSIEIQLIDGDFVQAITTGYVKRLEITPFSKDPMVQLTISCLEPYLTAMYELYLEPDTLADPVIENVGTAPTGFHMEVIFTSALSQWSLVDAKDRVMQFDYDFLPNDTLVFDTRFGMRTIELTRELITTSIIRALSKNSIWLQLHAGMNQFYTSSQAFNWGDIYYRPKYWGI